MATDSIMGAARFALASGVVALLAKRLATLATSVATLHATDYAGCRLCRHPVSPQRIGTTLRSLV